MGSLYSEYLSPSKVLEHYNYTKETLDTQETTSRWVALAIIVLICFTIVVENLMVLIAVARNSKFHSAMYLFLGNLAASDLLTGVAFVANTLLSGPVTLGLTPLEWFAREGSAFITLSASVFSLLAIAIERHVAIAKVKLYGSDKSCRMLLLIVASWLISLVLGGLPILGWNCLGHLEACSTVLPLYTKHYVLCVVTIFSVILLAIVALYVRIYCVVRSSHVDVTGPQTLALLKTVTIVLGVFIVCWLPAFSILLLDYACPVRSCPVLYKAHYFFAFATLNSLLNPVIYTWRSRDLRREVLRPLQCCRRAAGVQGAAGRDPGPSPPASPQLQLAREGHTHAHVAHVSGEQHDGLRGEVGHEAMAEGSVERHRGDLGQRRGVAKQDAPAPQTWVVLKILHARAGRLRHQPVGWQSCRVRG